MSIAVAQAHGPVLHGQEVNQAFAEAFEAFEVVPENGKFVADQFIRVVRGCDDAVGSNPSDSAIREHVQTDVCEHRIIFDLTGSVDKGNLFKTQL